MASRIGALTTLLLALPTLAGCQTDIGPCVWNGQQDRETGQLVARSISCDGVAREPATLAVRYDPLNNPLVVRLDAVAFAAELMFDPSVPDGTYAIMPPGAPDRSLVTSSGAMVSGSFTFTRSRDVPFLDLARPSAKTYSATIEATFDLVAVLPHPDPAMGVGCRMETGEQQVSLVVAGPVVECEASLSAGH